MSEFSHRPPCRIVHYRFGDPLDVLRVEESPMPRGLRDGEVSVRVTRSVIHPGDLQLIATNYPSGGKDIPNGRVPGSEGAGILEAAAPGALDDTGIGIGDRVAFFASAAWQSQAIVPAASLIAVPDDLPDDVAAQVLVNTVTARHVLRAAFRALGSRPAHIVQTAAASAVGRLITAFALRDGLRPVRLVRSRESAARLTNLLTGGEIVAMSDADWEEAVRIATKGDIPLVVDGAGGATLEAMSRLLNPKGHLMSYGLLDGRPADLRMFVPKTLSLHGVTIGTWHADATEAERAADMAVAIDIARSHPKLFGASRTFELSDLDAAIAEVGTSGKTGDPILKL